MGSAPRLPSDHAPPGDDRASAKYQAVVARGLLLGNNGANMRKKLSFDQANDAQMHRGGAQMRTFSTQPPLPLSPKHRAFCEAYVLDGIGYKAAIGAGYSVKSSRLQAYRLRRRVDVQAYIKVLEEEIESERADMAAMQPVVTREWIAAKFRAIAAVSPVDLMVPDGNGGLRWKLPNELTSDQREAISEIKLEARKPTRPEDGHTVTRVASYKLHDSKDATDSLARILGMNRDRVEHSHDHSVKALFQFVAGREATSETTARLRARYGNAGARVIEHEATPEPAELRKLRRLRGV